MIISGKELSTRLKQQMRDQVAGFPQKYGRVPHLVVILVGDNPASVSYVTGKAKASEAVGIRNTTIRKPESISEEELLSLIRELNADDGVDGILVQLPLPKHISEDKVIATIAKEKDVDGFHLLNVGSLVSGRPAFAPCTPSSIMQLIKSTGVKISGKNAVVIGRSNVVGRPAAMLLLGESATVTICHSKTANLKEHTLNADILVAAVGVPGLVTGDMIKPGAIVIDAGINRVEGKTVGDVDFASAEPVAGYISPVPGGVGPVTRTILVANTLTAAEKLNGLD